MSPELIATIAGCVVILLAAAVALLLWHAGSDAADDHQ
ncbi:MAG: hypothetical protein RL456_1957 [Pseudomonadota bacterium]